MHNENAITGARPILVFVGYFWYYEIKLTAFLTTDAIINEFGIVPEHQVISKKPALFWASHDCIQGALETWLGGITEEHQWHHQDCAIQDFLKFNVQSAR